MTAVADRTNATRVLDVLGAAGLAIVTAPVWLVIAAAVKLTSPGPVVFRAVRIGREGRPFTLLKFRSMRAGADRVGPGVTAAGDPRVTPVGRVLRATKLDELPQLVNVLRGEMSLVGPRPEDPRYVERYTDAQREILIWRPGITSPASVEYRGEEGILASMGSSLEDAYAVLMARKIDLDLAYFRRRSVLGDLRILAATVAAVVRR